MRFAARFAASIVGFGTIVVIARGAAGAPAPPPAPDSSPTADSIRTLVEQGQYPQALAQANRALAVKGAAARGYNRYDVLVLKGEALLRMKNPAAAASAFDDAAGFAAEEKAWALARSMAELVRRSKNLTYTPALAPAPAPAPGAAAPKAFDVTDKSQRTPAFAAMFEESKPKVAAAVKAGATSSSLPDVLEVMRKLADLRTLELAATEDTA